ncbi:LacI family DNA-binding transcriptional regulator [Anaerobium acetethylicum]|uniref:LacI family transcriptional regulator n=1 Tax=Anaerobium acetethylicum TaxID=1619234 RepID=A0A1D3TV78_9FIRM|nr:LacI family DNA-binding transcriptional regulator [Anaerobium acetethylicum]SCP97998.1 LacI family transcriptional regulator [Anaerobium acetethylicum]
MASINDVAKRAGVSISTVSNVLNETKYVSPELSRKVNVAVQELGYEADPVARNLKTKNTKTIGVLTADIGGLFYPYVVKSIYEVANQRGYRVIIYDLNSVNGEAGSFEREKESFKELISNRVDGIIFFSTVSEDMERAYMKSIKKLTASRKKTALVSIERDFSKYGIDSVFSDSVEGSKKATEHLIDCGCRRIGHITGPMNSKVAHDRMNGYKLAMKEHGFQVEDETMISFGDYNHVKGYTCMKELIKSMPDIEGVFAANDQMAVGACKAIKEWGKRIPEDVKVIGYDNVFVSSMVDPPLSTISIGKKHIGYEAVKALLKQMGNEKESEAVCIDMKARLVARKSTDIQAPEDWILAKW